MDTFDGFISCWKSQLNLYSSDLANDMAGQPYWYRRVAHIWNQALERYFTIEEVCTFLSSIFLDLLYVVQIDWIVENVHLYSLFSRMDRVWVFKIQSHEPLVVPKDGVMQIGELIEFDDDYVSFVKQSRSWEPYFQGEIKNGMYVYYAQVYLRSQDRLVDALTLYSFDNFDRASSLMRSTTQSMWSKQLKWVRRKFDMIYKNLKVSRHTISVLRLEDFMRDGS